MTLLRSGTASTVRDAITRATPLAGADGFAGVLDGQLVRDVLGREPLFVDPTVDAPITAAERGETWAFRPTALVNPQSFPAGHVGTAAPDRVWSLPTPEPHSDTATALTQVSSALTASFERIDPTLPVAFSGGLDSGALATQTTGPLVVTGFEGSHDRATARDGAAALDRELIERDLTHAELKTATQAVAEATGRTNPMDIAIAVPLYVTAQTVAERGYEQLVLGQGADELFGGYTKVANAPDDPRVAATTIRGARNELLGTLPEQLERDVLAIRAADVEPVVPYLADKVVSAALALPESLLVDDGTRKVALRQATADLLPATIRTREKKALQYGSYVSRELDRLARQAGFKRRMDDHVHKYIESLLE